jgi:hypothetical protein
MNRGYWLIPALLAAAAAEADPGAYVGVGVGTSRITASEDIPPLEGTDFGYKVYGGYRFRDELLPLRATLAVEGGYVDLGEPDDRVLGDNKAAFDVQGFHVSAMAVRELRDRWEIFGRAGVFFYDSKIKLNGQTLGKDDGSETVLSLGGTLRLREPLSIRFEIENLALFEDSWLSSVSVTFSF